MENHLEVTDPQAYCEALTKKRESNFSLGFQFLPPDKRRAIHVVYAFCRYVDDIADDTKGEDPSRLLETWKSELFSVYERSQSAHPIGQALIDVLKRFSIPAEGFLDLIRGCEQDQRKKQYQTFSELADYCELVATSIAKVSLPVYGFRDYEEAFGPARDLSFAFQLTNILRDIREDARRGRCYLPQEDLGRFGLTCADVCGGNHRERIFKLFQFEGERCETHFKKGREVLKYLHADSRHCVRVMIGAYHTLLEKILRDPMRALESQTVLTDDDKKRIIGASET